MTPEFVRLFLGGTCLIVVLSGMSQYINKKNYFIKDQFIRKPNNEGHSICIQYTESIIHLRFRVELFYVRSDFQFPSLMDAFFSFFPYFVNVLYSSI